MAESDTKKIEAAEKMWKMCVTDFLLDAEYRGWQLKSIKQGMMDSALIDAFSTAILLKCILSLRRKAGGAGKQHC